MAINYPGPYEMRIFYDTQLAFGRHTMKLNIDLLETPSPGEDFENISLKTHNESSLTLDESVEGFLTALVPLFNTSVDFSLVELWSYAAESFEGTFVSAYDPVISSGDSGAAIQPAGQAIVTFRTALGGIAKLSLMESILPPAVDQSFPTNTAAVNTLAANFTTPNQGFLGRDNSRPIAAKGFYPGQNEALWKKYNRTST